MSSKFDAPSQAHAQEIREYVRERKKARGWKRQP